MEPTEVSVSAPEVEPVGIPELVEAVGERTKELLRNEFKNLMREMNTARGILEDNDRLREAAKEAHRELCILSGSHNKVAMGLRAALDKDNRND